MESKVKISSVLSKFSVISVDYNNSWKKRYAKEKFTSAMVTDLSGEELDKFLDRLREVDMYIQTNKSSAQGEKSTGEDLYWNVIRRVNSDVPKTRRSVVFGTTQNRRPVGEEAFANWSGFQVIDIDCKDPVVAQLIKEEAFRRLQHCPWFMASVLSSSGSGVHIYTCIEVDENLDPKILFNANFHHKLGMVYMAIRDRLFEAGYSAESIIKWLDWSMCRPQQGVFITADPKPYFSTKFYRDFIHVGFDYSGSWGDDDLEKFLRKHDDLVMHEEEFRAKAEVVALEGVDAGSYKHEERWKLANTLVAIYGKEEGLRYLTKVCRGTDAQELTGLCNTAYNHKKPINKWAVEKLNSDHGFHIVLEGADEEEIMEISSRVPDPNHLGVTETITFNITKDQFLGDILPDIESNLAHLNLIDAGPGLGKTEMIKRLAKKSRILMVMPYTSTIKSKVEQEEGWEYSYGSKKVNIQDSERVVLTLDKFSRLTASEISMAGFDYVVIDESHLLFLSEYRSVMKDVVNLIRNIEVTTILLSGTPSGEFLFFPGIRHIHVIKEESRAKTFDVITTVDQKNMLFYMARHIARDITEGHRVIFPTNRGSTFAQKVEAAVNYFLLYDHNRVEPVRLKYYKRSQVGSDWMDEINQEATINDLEILMCTSYLSVGVDIRDKYQFKVYFSEEYMACEVDQWANRIRNNDLHIKLFVARHDGEGNPKNLGKCEPLSFEEMETERMANEAILAIVNADIQKGEYGKSYNPLINGIISDSPFIIWDTKESRYVIDDTCYKLVSFERKYRKYSEQLPVLIQGMKCYGYQVSCKPMVEFPVEDTGIFTDVEDVCRNMISKLRGEQHELVTELLDEVNETNLVDFAEVIGGRREILIGKRWGVDDEGIMRGKDLEVFDKVVPILLSLTKRYDLEDSKKFFTFCRNKNGTYNFSAVQRLRVLSNILFNKEENLLHLDIDRFMEDCSEFVKKKTVTKEEIEEFVNTHADAYLKNLECPEQTVEKTRKSFDQLFRVLVERKRENGAYTITPVTILWQTRKEKEDEIREHLFDICTFIDPGVVVETYDFNKRE